MMKTYLICFFICFFFSISFSQIVNIEDKRKHQVDTSGLYGYLDFGLNIIENGNSILNLRSGMQIEMHRKKHLFLAISKLNFIRVENNKFVNDGFQHLRYNYTVSPKLTYEAFGQLQYNERVRIKLRGLLGAGIRVSLTKEESKNKAYYGLAYMYEYDEIKDTSIFHRDHRMSTYLSFNLQPNSTFSISGTTYFQPLFSDLGNSRISSSTSMRFKISSKLSFRFSFQLTHDSRLKEDAPDVPSTFYSVNNTLRWDF